MTIADPRVTANMAVPTLPGQPLNAAWVNNVSVSLQKAVDSVGGGVIQPSPEIEIQGDGLKVTGPFSASAATTITTATLNVTGVATLAGQTVRQPHTPLTATNHVLDPEDGNRYWIASPGATTYHIDLKQSSPTPETGAWIRVFLPSGATSPGGYIFRDADDLTELYALTGYHADITGSFPATIEFEFNGSSWELSDATLGCAPIPP